MRRLVDLVKIDRLDNLIRRKATGNPEELAERLELSRSSLFDRSFQKVVQCLSSYGGNDYKC